jgi:hypothetical protein
MTLPRDDDRIAAYLDGAMERAERESFEAEIRARPELADAVAEQRAFLERLRGALRVGADASDEARDSALTARILDGLDDPVASADVHDGRVLSFWSRVRWFAAAAAAALVVVTVLVRSFGWPIDGDQVLVGSRPDSAPAAERPAERGLGGLGKDGGRAGETKAQFRLRSATADEVEAERKDPGARLEGVSLGLASETEGEPEPAGAAERSHLAERALGRGKELPAPPAAKGEEPAGSVERSVTKRSERVTEESSRGVARNERDRESATRPEGVPAPQSEAVPVGGGGSGSRGSGPDGPGGGIAPETHNGEVGGQPDDPLADAEVDEFFEAGVPNRQLLVLVCEPRQVLSLSMQSETRAALDTKGWSADVAQRLGTSQLEVFVVAPARDEKAESGETSDPKQLSLEDAEPRLRRIEIASGIDSRGYLASDDGLALVLRSFVSSGDRDTGATEAGDDTGTWEGAVRDFAESANERLAVMLQDLALPKTLDDERRDQEDSAREDAPFDALPDRSTTTAVETNASVFQPTQGDRLVVVRGSDARMRALLESLTGLRDRVSFELLEIDADALLVPFRERPGSEASETDEAVARLRLALESSPGRPPVDGQQNGRRQEARDPSGQSELVLWWRRRPVVPPPPREERR